MQNISISNAKGECIELEQFLAFLNEKFLEVDTKNHPILVKNGPYEVLHAEPGTKYIKIVATHPSRDFERAGARVYCFIDFKGNIYKAASWKAPAKHIRGSIFDINMSWGISLDRYGAVYLR